MIAQRNKLKFSLKQRFNSPCDNRTRYKGMEFKGHQAAISIYIYISNVTYTFIY